MSTATHHEPQAPFAAQPNPYAATSAPVAESRGFSVASLVLGIVSIVASYTFVVPAAGLVLGIMALKREPASRTMAIWGIVLNAVMLGGAVLVGIGAAVVGLAMLPFAFI
ncbi:DUF4190 domain-containing protein [Agromyces sp. SYSU K20354]|uniref:DUF4190 domain-containing protein n=1 Tax=Agromyces cavernae TaxID=2898659 RepID=UPI001E559187|nr:DUF4190 domain-containing protein [Agromyces cavernae]MCD2443835.1 DUF4190 domain-containing protein [Agromyces cavernae]